MKRKTAWKGLIWKNSLCVSGLPKNMYIYVQMFVDGLLPFLSHMYKAEVLPFGHFSQRKRTHCKLSIQEIRKSWHQLHANIPLPHVIEPVELVKWYLKVSSRFVKNTNDIQMK